ncbi:MAG: hypothetical protein ACKOW2_09000 [Sphingobacteriaceae bacterium]
MKNLNIKWQIAGIAVATILSFTACKKSSIEQVSPQTVVSNINSINTTSIIPASTLPSTSTSSPYLVTLESIVNNGDGTYTWIWSVQNPNPGNGSGGTVQDLSHWNITLGECAKMEDIVSGATSTDGSTWTSFVPLNRIDPSQDCYTDTVLKFDVGTRDTIKTFYQLTVNQNFSINDSVTAVYKSGRNTGCGTFVFSGFGCPIPVVDNSCSLSQGYYFAKPDLVWASTVTVGGYTYTQAEGKAIWNTSNKGGIKDSKAGFTQVTAIKLSSATISPSASVWVDVAIVENYLSGLGKLSPTNLPTGNLAAKEAAGRIGNWIDTHHCDN